MHYLTPAEQERLAYAEGYTETAAILARLDDAHRALGDTVAMQAQIDDLQDRVDALEDDCDKLQDRIGALEDERYEAQEQAKTYRSALMAIESEVPAHIRQFIREVLE